MYSSSYFKSLSTGGNVSKALVNKYRKSSINPPGGLFISLTDTVQPSHWPAFHVNVEDYIRINWSQTILSLVVECGSKFNAIIVSEGKLRDRREEGAAAF